MTAAAISDAVSTGAERLETLAVVDTPHALVVSWDEAPGATKAVVDAASFDLDVSGADTQPTEPFEASVTQVGGQSLWDVTVPSGLRVRTLALTDLTDAEGNLITEAGFPESGRLTVALPDPRTGFGGPTFAVPPVDPTGMLPAMLGGASFTSGQLSLPDVPASKLRVAVGGGEAPFAPRADVTLGKVSGVGVRYPRELALTDASGTAVWSNPTELLPTAPSLHVDVKAPLQKALGDALKAAAGGPVSVTFTLSSARSAKLVVRGLTMRGALVRIFPGVVRTIVAGERVRLALPTKPGDPPLLIDATAEVTADVTLHYDGLRIVPWSDAPPAADAVRGRVVGADPVLRVLPPEGLAGERVARIGLVGCAPEPCELSVRLVRPVTGEPLPGDPGVARLEPSATIATVWVEPPQALRPAEPAAVAARATRGRFFWATDAGDRPRVRIAVLDDAPAERRLALGGALLPDDPAQPHRAAVDLTAHFGSPVPEFESDLFYSVDLSDLTVRYAR